MSDQFYVTKKSGVKRGDIVKGTGEDEEQLLTEGTKEKGPWYNKSDFRDRQRLIDTCLERGWIEFMEKKVE